MKNTMWKTTLREIRQSMGRFLAILAIVALGVSLFAGLKVTKPFMIKTAEEYLAEKNFYDFQLLTSYGFEEQDVEYLASMEGVKNVQGSYTYDVLYEYSNTDTVGVMKVHSLTKELNELEIVYGRLPEADNECVVDLRMFGEEAIGQTIRLSKGNEEELLEDFNEKEFNIVGVAKAPYYMQFERGNTSLGTGQVDAFMYVPKGAFFSEIYTEVFVKLSENYPLYSDAYDEYIDGKEKIWEEYLKVAADNRFDRIVAEAEKELADGWEEFYAEKADAEEELADARQELLDAATEIADAKQEIADAKQEIADGYAELAEKEQELLDGEKELKENEETLLSKEQELSEGLAKWNKNNDIVESSKDDLRLSEETLNQQEQQLLAQEQQLVQQEQQLLLAYGVVPEPYATQIAEGKNQIAEGKAQIAAYREEIRDGYSKLAKADRELGRAWMEMEDGRVKLEEGKKEIEDAKIELADGKQKLADAKKELSDAEIEIVDAEKELADGEEEYADGLAEYEEGLAEFQEEIADAQAELNDARWEIDDLEEPDCYILGRDTNVGYVCLENDSSIVEDVSDVFPIFFFMVAALVCMTTMNRMIEEQRTQIGVLKALGYSNATIMGKYLFYSGSAAVFGCIGGFFLGTYLFPKVIWIAYGTMYDMVPLVFYIDWTMAAIALVVSLLCSMGVTWYSCRVELLEVAASLMRPKAPKAGKRIFLEYLTFVWKRLKFLQKVSIRNVLRYKKRFFMMIIGISGCTALLVAAFGIRDSVADVIGMQYSEIQLYDMSVTFQDSPDEELYEEYIELTEGKCDKQDMFMETSIDLLANDSSKSVSLLVPQNPETTKNYIDLHTLEGEDISFPKEGEAVITHKLAEDFELQVGDSIELTDEDYNTFNVIISGICQNFVGNYVFLHPDTCTLKWKEPEYKTAYINVPDKGTEDIHLFSAALLDLEGVANVTVSVDVEERFESMMSSMNYVVILVIVCAAALAFIVLYNLTNINITERIREIATIKVLGFYKNETATYVFRENLMLTAIGALAGLLLGKIFHAFVMSCINIEMVAFDVRVKLISYVYSFLLTFVFAWAVNAFMSGKIDKISMTESLKSVD